MKSNPKLLRKVSLFLFIFLLSHLPFSIAQRTYDNDKDPAGISLPTIKTSPSTFGDMVGINEVSYVFWDHVYDSTWENGERVENQTVVDAFKNTFSKMRLFHLMEKDYNIQGVFSQYPANSSPISPCIQIPRSRNNMCAIRDFYDAMRPDYPFIVASPEAINDLTPFTFRQFPDKWFTYAEWGGSHSVIKEEAYEYAKAFLETMDPDDDPLTMKVNRFYASNEHWGADLGADGYKSVCDGFIEGFTEYYQGSRTATPDQNQWNITLWLGAFQAHKASHVWDNDYVESMMSPNARQALAGLDVHPYSFDQANTNETILTKHPESVNSYFQSIKSMVKWRDDQTDNVQNMGISATEFGWNDDDVYDWRAYNSPTEGTIYVYYNNSGTPSNQPNNPSDWKVNIPGVGEPAQALYSIRAYLLMARWGLESGYLYGTINNNEATYRNTGVYETEELLTIYNQNYFKRENIFGAGILPNFFVGEKQIMPALRKFRNGSIIGNKKFLQVLKEDDNGLHAYLVGDGTGNESHLVAWYAADINKKTETEIQNMTFTENLANINLPAHLSIQTSPDYTRLDWHETQINNIPAASVYNSTTQILTVTPIPIVIPLSNNGGNCNLSSLNSSVSCNNNGTPSDPSDDTFIITIDPQGTGTSATYDVIANGVPYAGNSYNTPFNIPASFTISGGPISVSATDGQDPTCSISGNVNPPTPCSSGNNIDLELQLSVNNSSPPIYTNVVYTFTLTNTGSVNATGITVDVQKPSSLAYVSNTVSEGTYDDYLLTWSGIVLTPGETATLTLTLFTLSADPITLFTEVDAANETDADSSPNNGTPPTPAEDDEAAVTINGGTGNCNLSSLNSSVSCNDNGTPADPSDDTFTITIDPQGTGTSATYNVVANGVSYSGNNYNTPFSIPVSFNISGGPISVSATDGQDPTCSISENVNPPGTCSNGSCNLSSLNSSVSCNNNGTPADPSDDTFTITIDPQGTGTSTTYDVLANGVSYLGNSFNTPFNIPASFAISGGPITVSATDGQDPACSISGNVNPPAPCSSGNNIDLELQLSVNNSSPPIYTNVVYTFTLTNTGSINATGITVDVQKPSSLAYVSNTVSEGTYDDYLLTWSGIVLTPGETATLDLTLFTLSADPITLFTEVDAANETDADSSPDNGTPPTPTEDDEAAVTINGGTGNCNLSSLNSSVSCNDNGTPADPSDDTFTITIDPQGTGTSATYNVVANGVSYSGNSYNTPFNIPVSFNISGGPISVSATDGQYPSCSVSENVNPPGTCSNGSCNLTSLNSSTSCYNNGTPADPSDDTFTITIDPQGTGTSATYDVLANGVFYSSISYSLPFNVPTPFSISGGPISVSATDGQYPACSVSENVNPPAPCSSGNNIDLELQLSINNSSPPIYTNVVYTFTLTNTGSVNATGITVDVQKPGTLAYVSNTASEGTYDDYLLTWSGIVLTPGETATLDLTLFTLSADPITLFTEVDAANETDADSSPDNGTPPTPAEDDEAVVTINEAPINRQGGNLKNEFSLYPNPAKSELNVEILNDQASEIIVVHASGAKEVQVIQFAPGQHRLTINISDLPNGMYYLLLKDKGRVLDNEKFVKIE